jgi:sec-independent protein translocase protein TatB
LFEGDIIKIAVLAVIALVIFGPEQLPKMAAQAGRALRDLRRFAESARADLHESLGPEFSDFDFNDLNPRHFVRKHLLDDLNPDDFFGPSAPDSAIGDGGPNYIESVHAAEAGASLLIPGEVPPYDEEAT